MVQPVEDFIVSCGLLGLTFALHVYPGNSDTRGSLKSAGILQLTWVLSKDSHFPDVEEPELQVLRKKGLDYKVQVSGWRHAKHVSDDEEMSELIYPLEKDDSKAW